VERSWKRNVSEIKNPEEIAKEELFSASSSIAMFLADVL